MQNREIIEAVQNQTGKPCTVTQIKTIASRLGIPTAGHYSDEDGHAILSALLDRPQPTQPSRASSDDLATQTEVAEGAIITAFQQQTQSIAHELVQAKQARDAFAEQAAEALAQLAIETKPLIYHLAEQKVKAAMQQPKTGEFSIAALASEAFALPALPDSFLLTATIAPH